MACLVVISIYRLFTHNTKIEFVVSHNFTKHFRYMNRLNFLIYRLISLNVYSFVSTHCQGCSQYTFTFFWAYSQSMNFSHLFFFFHFYCLFNSYLTKWIYRHFNSTLIYSFFVLQYSYFNLIIYNTFYRHEYSH